MSLVPPPGDGALGHAVRDWALREPSRYALLFGSPVPGYRAPAERTTGPGTRVVVALMAILDGAFRAGQLSAEGRRVPALDAGLAGDLAKVRTEFGLAVPDDLLARATLAWTSLFGAVSFEIFGQYGEETFTARKELFDHHLAVLGEVAGLPPVGAVS